ncbi:hypothetical protein FAI40_00870 [Acetobacteraceae bacterium]|nr:hypothetical protein FAI40_00870 [Acetobacteraceae bacterium]
MSKRLVQNKEEIIENIRAFHTFVGLRRTAEDEKEYKDRVWDAIWIIKSRIGEDYFWTPSKFVGYYRNNKPNTLAFHRKQKAIDGSDGRETTPKLKGLLLEIDPKIYPIVEGDADYDQIDNEYKAFQEKICGKSSNYGTAEIKRKYWVLGEEFSI